MHADEEVNAFIDVSSEDKENNTDKEEAEDDAIDTFKAVTLSLPIADAEVPLPVGTEFLMLFVASSLLGDKSDADLVSTLA